MTVQNKHGLHFRFAGLLAATANKFQSNIEIQKGRKGVDAKSMLDLVSLSAAPGSILTVCATGDDAEDAITAITSFVNSYQGDK